MLEVELAITTGASTRPTSHRPQLLLERLACAFPRLRHIRADMRYHGRAVEWIKAQLGWTVRRSLNACRSGGATPVDSEPPPMPRWTTLPRRWVVGRTFAWLGRYRRMSQDCEYRTEASEAFIYAATVRLMLGKAGANVSRNRLMRAFQMPSNHLLRICANLRKFQKSQIGMQMVSP